MITKRLTLALLALCMLISGPGCKSMSFHYPGPWRRTPPNETPAEFDDAGLIPEVSIPETTTTASAAEQQLGSNAATGNTYVALTDDGLLDAQTTLANTTSNGKSYYTPRPTDQRIEASQPVGAPAAEANQASLSQPTSVAAMRVTDVDRASGWLPAPPVRPTFQNPTLASEAPKVEAQATQPQTQVRSQVQLQIHGVRVGAAPIRIAVAFNAADFPNGQASGILQTCEASQSSMVTSVDLGSSDDPKVPFAVAVYQDLDLNGQLTRNRFGVPMEPYGFSRNARGRRGPPSFDEAVVEPGTAMIAIELK